MKNDTLFDDRFADLLLQARGLQVVRNLLAARGATDAEVDEHTRALERVRHQLAEKLVA
jgi:hypothetical protein